MEKIRRGGNDFLLLDVRTKGEFHDSLSSSKHLNLGHIRGALNIPIQDLQQKPEMLQRLEAYKDRDIYVICSHSYRSRTVSKLLLSKNFSKVTNVRGGMSEWFRDYDQLKSFEGFREKNVSYNYISPSQLLALLKKKEKIGFFGFSNPPRFFFDSLITNLYRYFPDFRNTSYFRAADSARILEKARQAGGKTLVLYNTVGAGGAEIAEWLTLKGIRNVYYLAGNLAGFFEHLANFENKHLDDYLSEKSRLNFFTPLSFCQYKPGSYQWVDLRHDTVFNKITNGTRLSYKTIRGAINFPFYKTAEEFISLFPDKTKSYLVIPQQGYVGLELANELVEKGYRMFWLLGGIERWEWYTNNIPGFPCADDLVK
jgi:rhodanese-related sulfurtransferase